MDKSSLLLQVDKSSTIPGCFVRIGIGMDPITRINVYRLAEMNNKELKNLLSTLNLRHLEINSVDLPSSIHLPSSLRSLHLSSTSDNLIFPPVSSITHLSIVDLPTFPQFNHFLSVTHLHLTSKNDVHVLPPSLVYLHYEGTGYLPSQLPLSLLSHHLWQFTFFPS